jgi:hypothetical protein
MASNDKQTNDLLNYLKAHTTMNKQKANGKAFTRNFFLHDREGFVTYDGSRKIIGKARICKSIIDKSKSTLIRFKI